MAGGSYRTLIAAAWLGAATIAAAQNPPSPRPPVTPARPDSARRDSLARQLVLDEMFPAGNSAMAPRAVLTEGVVYRLEIQPAEALVSVTSVRHPSLPPLFLVPVEGGGPVGENQTAAFLLVPRSTDEYRLTAQVTGNEPVRLRVWTDPKEMARYTRIRAEGFRLPTLAAAVHVMYLSRFRDAYASPFDTLYGYTTEPQAAVGLKGCLAVVPNGRLLPDRLGGCALALTFWRRGAGRNFYSIGIEPEVVVIRRPSSELSLSPQLAFGNTTGGAPRAAYVFIGAGGRYGWQISRSPSIGFQLEATLLDVRSLPNSYNPSRVSALALSLGAGLIFPL